MRLIQLKISPAVQPMILQVGWNFRKAQTIRHRGILDGFGVSRQQCEAMIIRARVRIGWITS
jgi:hypothetical protein